MFKMIDDDSNFEGFGYTNKIGNKEYVAFEYDMVQLKGSDFESISDIYITDIPNLIKALKAAYDYKQKDAF